MDMFSLEEEDDFNGLFVTQTPQIEKVNVSEMSDINQGSSGSLSLLKNVGAMYSDILDDEVFEMPSSQPYKRNCIVKSRLVVLISV